MTCNRRYQLLTKLGAPSSNRQKSHWATVPNRVDFERLFVKQIASLYDDLGLAFELIRL